MTRIIAKGLPVLLALVVLVAVGVQVLAHMLTPPPTPLDRPPLAGILPDPLPGWTARDLDLGPTESVTEASMRILNLDDFVYRDYSHPGHGNFSVYVAYWGPGKMPIRLVSQHTPDRCWTENGWVCTDRRFNVERSVGDIRLQPAQWGEYMIQGHKTQAYFWHLVDGEMYWLSGNHMNTRTTIKSVLIDIRNMTFRERPRQYFVRIVSDHSLDELWDQPQFQAVMEVLADLGLAYNG